MKSTKTSLVGGLLVWRSDDALPGGLLEPYISREALACLLGRRHVDAQLPERTKPAELTAYEVARELSRECPFPGYEFNHEYESGHHAGHLTVQSSITARRKRNDESALATIEVVDGKFVVKAAEKATKATAGEVLKWALEKLEARLDCVTAPEMLNWVGYTLREAYLAVYAPGSGSAFYVPPKYATKAHNFLTALTKIEPRPYVENWTPIDIMETGLQGIQEAALRDAVQQCLIMLRTLSIGPELGESVDKQKAAARRLLDRSFVLMQELGVEDERLRKLMAGIEALL